MKKSLPLFAFLFLQVFIKTSSGQSPGIEILTFGTNSSLRGLSVVNNNVIWVSGSNGIVGKSTNGGKNWRWFVVKGFEKTEFRDIEAFDTNVAIIMAVGEPAYILKTIDGGESWKVVYENKTVGMFLDAMDFANSRMGIVIGDPIENKIFIAYTYDSGNSWQEMDKETRPVADTGEAFFAASGTNVKFFANKDYFMVSGGRRSRFFSKEAITSIPIVQGKESAGANSIDIYDDGIPDKPGKRIVVVGGDFSADTATDRNCTYSTNGGKTWNVPKTPPHGYRSSVEFISEQKLLSCGPTGIDYSRDGGKTWKWISKESFHVCKIARIGGAIFFAGANGKVGRIVWKE